MFERQKKRKNVVKDISFRVIKATLKAIIIYLIYFLVAPLVAPLLGLIPGFIESLEVFVAVYIALMILGDLTSNTVFQYFFGTARVLFFMSYLLLSMGDGVFSTNYQNFNLTVNLTMFYTIMMLLNLLGLARIILQAIKFMHEKAEANSGLQL